MVVVGLPERIAFCGEPELTPNSPQYRDTKHSGYLIATISINIECRIFNAVLGVVTPQNWLFACQLGWINNTNRYKYL